MSDPLTEERYDIVVDTEKGFIPVQVKRMRPVKDGVFQFDCKSNYSGITSGRTYTDDEIEGFISHNPTKDSIYWVHVDEAPTTNMNLRDKESRQPNVNMISDFRIEDTFVEEYPPRKV